MKLCLGTVQLGMKYGIAGGSEFSRCEAVQLLAKAFELGIDAFDTASAYGDAELILSTFLKDKYDIDVKIISKSTGRTSIETDLSKTLKTLDMCMIDGYLFHEAAFLYEEQKIKELVSLKDVGLVKNIGVSIYKPEDALHAVMQSWVDYIQIPYNALDQRLDKTDFFEIAKNNGKMIFARSTLLQGLMAMSLEEIKARIYFAFNDIQKYIEIVNRYGKTQLEAAIEYVKENKKIDYLVFGVDNIDQLLEFVRIFKDNNVSHDLVQELKYTFSNVSERVLSPNQW